MPIRYPGLRKSLGAGVVCLGLAGIGLVAAVQNQSAEKEQEYKEYDRPYFEAAKAGLLDRSADHRLSAMGELVRRNAKEARQVLATVLDDSSSEIRRSAAEYLAMMGDERGLKVQAWCLKAPECSQIRHHAARLLGASGRAEYAALIAEEVRKSLARGLTEEGKWRGSAEERAILEYGAIALARLGRPEDHDLILKAVEATRFTFILEALGYVEHPRSFEILWSAHSSMLRKPACSEAGLGVSALVPLSRLGDQRAIELLKDILRGIGTIEKEWRPGTLPSLCADREQAFLALKPRDAANFAETVLEVAAQDPEGPGSIEAWTALGLMRPAGYGERVFKLAMRKKPHWKLVTRDMLHDAILAIDPSLNDAFWKEYGVSPIPTYSGRKALVEMGLHRLMFPGTGVWTGD